MLIIKHLVIPMTVLDVCGWPRYLISFLFPFIVSDDAVVRARLSEALETVLNKIQEPSKSKKVQHSNAKNAVLFESINLILHFKG